jgi:hypothetical protein
VIPACISDQLTFSRQRIGKHQPVRRVATLLTGGARPYPG